MSRTAELPRQAGSGDTAENLVEEVASQFEDFGYLVDGHDRPWFEFANGEWGQACSRVWLRTPDGWFGIDLLEADDVPVLVGVGWPDNRDLSFRNNEAALPS